MNDNDLGESVTRAIEFLWTISEDAKALFSSLEQLFADHGWECVFRSRTSAGGALYYDLYSLYAPSNTNGKARCLILIQGRLAETVVKYPLLLAALVAFDNPVDPKSTWDSWRQAGGLRVMKYLHDHGARATVPSEVLSPDFAAGASCGFGSIVPMCTLRSADDVGERVVQVILGAVSDLGCIVSRAGDRDRSQ